MNFVQPAEYKISGLFLFILHNPYFIYKDSIIYSYFVHKKFTKYLQKIS